MAKIGGRKNTQAWQRTNVFLTNMPESQQPALATAIEACDNMEAAFAAIMEFVGNKGFPDSDWYSSTTEWAAALSLNVPLDVYMGKVSYDEYQKEDVGGSPRYVPQVGPPLAKFASELRKVYQGFMFGERQIVWLYSITHKQGVPPYANQDAVPAIAAAAGKAVTVPKVASAKKGRAPVKKA